MTFDELAECLHVEDFQESASELHGLLAGRIAGGERLDGKQLAVALMESLGAEEELVDNAKAEMEQLYTSIVAAFDDQDFSFQPLLPSDDEPLPSRVLALSEWCESFLSGLGQSGLHSQHKFTEEAQAGIDDLAAIAQVGYEEDDDGDAENDEVDFFELQEYVRMAAILIFAELNPLAATPPSQTLH